MSALIQRKLQQAQERLHDGDLSAAASLCENVLKQAPRNPHGLWLLGATHLAGGHADKAIPLLEQAVGGMPQHGAALEHLGLGYLLLNRHTEAEAALRKAAALPGAPASVYMRLGLALLNQARFEDAVACLKQAAALDPADALCHLNLGWALAEAGDVAAAQKQFETVLRLAPGHIDAMFNLGVLALKREDLPEAQSWFERVLANAPSYADASVNLGIVRQKQRRLDEALACFRRALALNPTLASARNNLARTLLLQGKAEEARQEYVRTVQAAPHLAEAQEGLAAACAALGRYKEAIAHLRAVLEREPNSADAWSALGHASFQMGALQDAETAAMRAMDIEPALVGPYSTLAEIHFVRGELERSIEVLERGFERTRADGLLGMLNHDLRRACNWERWRETWPELRLRLDGSADLGSPFWLLNESTTAAEQLAYTRRWAEVTFRTTAPEAVGVPAKTRAAVPSRLRIGYLSSDFQEHPAAYLMAGVLERHNRERFEIFAYSYGPQQDTPMRTRLQQACEHFLDVAWESDDAIVRRIRDDALDVLVDLKGYTLGARTSILAQRPCAIQVNWLGYPGTMGAPFMDYLITDGFIVPPGHESAYSERVLRLAHCWQCNDRSRPLPEPLAREAYGLREEDFVFCCFAQAVKITPDMFECWMRLLKRVPHGVLWLAEDNALATENLKNAAQAHGVAPGKLIFAPKVPFAQYLARYRVADLALDTFPYTSHSTASDALWAGCPLVALCGETFASRVSGSILTHAGLTDLVTHTLEHYEALACSFATDRALSSALRTRVAEAKASPLFDADSFARDLERLYTHIAQ